MRKIILLLTIAALMALTATTALANRGGGPPGGPPGGGPQGGNDNGLVHDWDGRGSDSLKCELYDGDKRGDEGWIHWVFSTKGESTSAELTIKVGDDTHTFEPGDPLNANVWHFYTPYFDLDGLTAEIKLIGGSAGPGGGLVISDFCPGFKPLEVEKTAEGTYDRKVDWELEKTVDPDKHTGYAGEVAGTSGYTVLVTKHEELKNYQVTGEITINNLNPIDVEVEIEDYLDDGTVADVTCPDGTTEDGVTTATVPANDTLVCTYVADPDDGKAELNTVDVASLHPAVEGDSATADVEFVEKNVIGDDTVVLDDSQSAQIPVDLFPRDITESTTIDYDMTFVCPSDPSVYDRGTWEDIITNTATLTGDHTDLKDDAEVKVKCELPALEVKKTADAKYDRTVEWKLEKTVDPGSHTGNAGELAGSSIWTVEAIKNETLGNYRVKGTITVKNPAAIDQTILEIRDFIRKTRPDGGPHTVTDGVVECDTLIVPAGGEIECTYIVTPENDIANMNRAAVKAEGNAVQFVDVPFEWEEKLIGFDEGTLIDERFEYEEVIDESTTETFPEDFNCPVDRELYDKDGVYQFTEENVATLNGNLNLEDDAKVDVTCYIEQLQVKKTVDTSFDREHKWDIDKSVGTEKGHKIDGTPKIWLFADGSGNEAATWTVDVSYEGAHDKNFNASGTISFMNTGKIPATITGVTDLLGDDEIEVEVSCYQGPDLVSFPRELPAGWSLVCTYSQDLDEKVTGDNIATVTTEFDSYSATAPIEWGDPANETNKTVNIKDISDDFGEVPLGSVTAPNGDSFTYDEHFAYVDYGSDKCGSYSYGNTATIVETGQSADAELKVNVQCVIEGDGETAWAANGDDPGELRYQEPGNWATYVHYDGEKTTTLFAGQHMPAGTVHFSDPVDDWVTITINLNSWGFQGVAENLKVQDYAEAPSGNPAPGQFDHKTACDAGGSTCTIVVPENSYYGVHADVAQLIPDPNFGP